MSELGVQSAEEEPPGASRGGTEQRVVQAIADAIFERRLPPGTKLPEVDLCRIFGVSRGVVRKALNRLGSEKLLDLIPNRGAFVARPSVEQTRDVCEVRRILEGGVVRNLARKAPHAAPTPPPWLETLRRQIAEERDANRSGDTPRYIRLAGQFHLDLAAVTGNEELLAQLKRLISQTSLMVALYDVAGTNTCSFHEHLEILAAIESGDYGSAERLMDEHLVGLERQLRLGGEPQPIDLDRVFGAANGAPSQQNGFDPTETYP